MQYLRALTHLKTKQNIQIAVKKEPKKLFPLKPLVGAFLCKNKLPLAVSATQGYKKAYKLWNQVVLSCFVFMGILTVMLHRIAMV